MHFRAFNEVLAQYDFKISKKDYYKNFLGLSDLDLLNFLVENKLLNLNEQQISNIAEQKKNIFEELIENEGKIIEGVRDFLNMLKSNNIEMAICSGSLMMEIRMILEQAKLQDFFPPVPASR